MTTLTGHIAGDCDEDCANRTLSKFLQGAGYILVKQHCPECGWGQLVRSREGREACTAYGQCELAPG